MSENLKPNGQGLSRIYRATICSAQGIQAAYQHEAAFRQELTLAVILLPVAWFTSATFGQFVLLIASLLFVLIIELVNSAVEAVVDRISLEHSELAGRAKDMGSAAVTLALLVCFLVWAQHFYRFFFA
ncbi:diacylglycerol kinase [Saccharobesus litoralis]|uniref:Diacylglycerol kinase n=1 Tax=Saccharobesus litoralis TaxID=2172099 RepID=A0A2S0VQR0_9ALTE|nr:diacylglycerol kinase [Saccharobesus litoralis]AWB66551.1 diacylglycerol kinase [Saccharobesus litoralis]